MFATEDEIEKLLEAQTCGHEMVVFCEACGRDLPHICVDGYIRCPICGRGLGWCAVCVEDGEYTD